MLKEGVRTDRTRGGRQKYFRKVSENQMNGIERIGILETAQSQTFSAEGKLTCFVMPSRVLQYKFQY